MKAVWEDGGNVVRVQVPGAFSFSRNLAYLTRSPAESLFVVEDGRVLKRLDDAVMEIRSDEDRELQIRFWGDAAVGVELKEKAAQHVWEWFDLGRDLSGFYELAERDALLGPVIREWAGLRLIGVHDLFEAMCWSIMGQQITLSFAYQLKKSFVEAFGESVRVEERTFWSFPVPEAIAALSVEQLREMKFTTRKAEYLIHVAGLFVDGVLSKEGLLALGDLKLIEKKLTSIRGIGPWSANYVLMRCLRHGDAFPVQDVGLQNAVKQCLRMERKPTIGELHELSAGWGNWKAYATFYLWMMLMDRPVPS